MNINIARAWKDAEYRKTLSAAELALLPENPVGAVEISEDDASDVVGMTVSFICSVACSVVGCSIACSAILGVC